MSLKKITKEILIGLCFYSIVSALFTVNPKTLTRDAMSFFHEKRSIKLKFSDFKPFGYVSEKNYEGDSHWLMFLFDCLCPIHSKPEDFAEGCYEFFSRKEINKIKIPPSDSKLVWPFFDRRHEGFFGVNADCSQSMPKIRIEADPNL